MRPVIHEFLSLDLPPCENWHDGDGLTAFADAVTCPACHQRLVDAEGCPSRRRKDGKRCAGRRGHDGLHHIVAYDVLYLWTDDDAPKAVTHLRVVR